MGSMTKKLYALIFVALLFSPYLLFTATFFTIDHSSSPAHSMTIGDTNVYIGGTLSYASDPASWSIGMVPTDGENILFDARGGTGSIYWDIDLKPNDFTMLNNSTSIVIMSVHSKTINFDGYLHITGNLSVLGLGYINLIYDSAGSMSPKNFVVDGWAHLRGNESGGIYPQFPCAGYRVYFNGVFDVSWPTFGTMTLTDCEAVFNSSLTINDNATMEFDSCTGYVESIFLKNGTLTASRSQLEFINWDSYYGEFAPEADSGILLNSTGTLKTNGTIRGGFDILTIGSGASITLLSDVYVNYRLVNLGGTLMLNGYHLFLPIAGKTNEFIGTGYASVSAHWSLGHVPQNGENIQFDGRSGDVIWDIFVEAHDFTVLANATVSITVETSTLHITGNLSLIGPCVLSTTGYLADCNSNLPTNFFVIGWIKIRGNESDGAGPGIFLWAIGNYYFNGTFDVHWPTVGYLVLGGYCFFNDTVTVNGTWMNADATHFVCLNFITGYLTFKKDALFQGIHIFYLGSGEAHENITFKDIAAGADTTGTNASDGFLLMTNYPTGIPFTFYRLPVYKNITKCSTCGYSPYIVVRYNGELNQGYWDGWMADEFGRVDINITGIVNQSYSANYVSSYFPDIWTPRKGVLNVFSGTYRINGSWHLIVMQMSSVVVVPEGGDVNVYDTFELDSGHLYTGHLNLFNGSIFDAGNGMMEITHFDSSNGTFFSGHSDLYMNATFNYTSFMWRPEIIPIIPVTGINGVQTLKTNGTRSGGLWDLHITGTVDLLSDVWVNGNYSNKGTVNFNDFKIYNNGTILDDSNSPDDNLVSTLLDVFPYIVILIAITFILVLLMKKKGKRTGEVRAVTKHKSPPSSNHNEDPKKDFKRGL